MREQQISDDKEVRGGRIAGADYVRKHFVDRFAGLDPAVPPSFESHQCASRNRRPRTYIPRPAIGCDPRKLFFGPVEKGDRDHISAEIAAAGKK